MKKKAATTAKRSKKTATKSAKRKTTAKAKTATRKKGAKKTTAKKATAKKATTSKARTTAKKTKKTTAKKAAGAAKPGVRRKAPAAPRVPKPVAPMTPEMSEREEADTLERAETAGGTSTGEAASEARPVGVVTHYYSHLSVAVIQLNEGTLGVGDTIHIKGHTTDLEQPVESIEVDHQSVQEAGAGQAFGLKVRDHVREHDQVFKVENS